MFNIYYFYGKISLHSIILLILLLVIFLITVQCFTFFMNVIARIEAFELPKVELTFFWWMNVYLSNLSTDFISFNFFSIFKSFTFDYNVSFLLKLNCRLNEWLSTCMAAANEVELKAHWRHWERRSDRFILLIFDIIEHVAADLECVASVKIKGQTILKALS